MEEAGCTTCANCPDCGIKVGYPAGHKLMGDGQCENCEITVPAISVTANGKPVEIVYTTADGINDNNGGILYFEIYEGSDVRIVKTGANGYTDDYSWDRIKSAFQTTEDRYGQPAWRG